MQFDREVASAVRCGGVALSEVAVFFSFGFAIHFTVLKNFRLNETVAAIAIAWLRSLSSSWFARLWS